MNRLGVKVISEDKVSLLDGVKLAQFSTVYAEVLL